MSRIVNSTSVRNHTATERMARFEADDTKMMLEIRWWMTVVVLMLVGMVCMRMMYILLNARPKRRASRMYTRHVDVR